MDQVPAVMKYSSRQFCSNPTVTPEKHKRTMKLSTPLKRAVLALICCSCFAPFALADVYVCQVRHNGPYPIIADKIVLEIDEAKKRVLVADGILAYYGQVPAAGKLKRNDEKLIVASWKLRPVKATKERDGLDYIVSYQIQLKPHNMQVQVFAWIDSQMKLNGTGKCEKAKI